MSEQHSMFRRNSAVGLPSTDLVAAQPREEKTHGTTDYKTGVAVIGMLRGVAAQRSYLKGGLKAAIDGPAPETLEAYTSTNEALRRLNHGRSRGRGLHET